MQNNSANPSRDPQKEQLKKEQMKLRKTGIALCILAVVVMLAITALDAGYALVGISGVLGAIGGIMTARSYVHIKYQNLDK